MTPPQKPEWMALADADSVPSPKKAGRLIPAFIATVAIAIVGVGAIATQISDEPPASANEQVVPSQGNSSKASVPATSAATTNVTTPNSAQSAPVAPKQPSIATLPKSGGDNEREGRDGRGEHEGGEDEGEDD
jgi:hypothetical protein